MPGSPLRLAGCVAFWKSTAISSCRRPLRIDVTHARWVNSFDTSVMGSCSAPTAAGGDLQCCAIDGRTPLHTVWLDLG